MGDLPFLRDRENGSNVFNVRLKTTNMKKFEPVVWTYFPSQVKEGFGYLCYYSQFPDVYRVMHSYLENANHGQVAHTGYLAKGGSIESYLVNDSDLEKINQKIHGGDFRVEIQNRSDILGVDCGDVSEVIQKYGLNIEVVKRFKRLKKEIIEMHCKDVVHHCTGPYKKEVPEKWAGVNIVDKIVPHTKARIYPVKREYIVERGKGSHPDHDICRAMKAVEFSRGCWTTGTPEGFYDAEGVCGYCYGSNKVKNFAFKYMKFAEVGDIIAAWEESGLSKRKPHMWRFGKTSDPFLTNDMVNVFDISEPTYVENLLRATIELNKSEWKITPVLFTKFPEFTRERAMLLKDSGGTLFASMGKDCREPGAVRWGFDTQRRLEEIVEFKKFGLEKVGFSMLTDVTSSFEDNGEDLARVREISKKHDLLTMYLGPRIKKKIDAVVFTGRSKNELRKMYMKGCIGDLLDSGIGYRDRSPTNHSEIVTGGVHQDFLDEAKSEKGRVGLCISPGDKEACCGCFSEKKFVQAFRNGSYVHTGVKEIPEDELKNWWKTSISKKK